MSELTIDFDDASNITFGDKHDRGFTMEVSVWDWVGISVSIDKDQAQQIIQHLQQQFNL